MDGFAYFDAIFHACPAGDPLAEDRVCKRLSGLGIAARVEHTGVLSTAGDRRVGTVLSHRRAVAAARERNAGAVLLLSGDVLFLDRTHAVLAAAVAELQRIDWTVCHLGGWWNYTLQPEDACQTLDVARDVIDTHAVAYSKRVYARVLDEVPSEAADLADWVERNGDIDAYLNGLGRAVVVHPVVTTTPARLPFEASAMQLHFSV